MRDVARDYRILAAVHGPNSDGLGKTSTALSRKASVTALCKRLDAVMEREVDGEFLLLDTESNRIHQLNETASFIWRRCDAASPAAIAAELIQDYDVDEEQALSDVVSTLNTLRSLNLVAEA